MDRKWGGKNGQFIEMPLYTNNTRNNNEGRTEKVPKNNGVRICSKKNIIINLFVSKTMPKFINIYRGH